MILQCMRWDRLQQAKATIPDVYWRYYREADNKWMKEEWGEDLFVPLREVPDFSLAALRNEEGLPIPRGEVDVENCILVYEGLRKYITPAEASLETLWAGMCNANFYSYMRERWGYILVKQPVSTDAGAIVTRFFFGRGSTGDVYRNTIGKCWWIAHQLYDKDAGSEPYWRLRALGSMNFATKATDIFYNYGFSRNPHVLAGIVQGIQRCRTEGINIDDAQYCLRPALKHLNAVGGLVLLDAIPEDEIADILVTGAKRAVKEQQGISKKPDVHASLHERRAR